MRLLSVCTIACLALQAASGTIRRSNQGFKILEHPDPAKRELLQDIITWDPSSLFIHGERIMIFSGEFHPFRLPVPSLWLDIFQKIKALGFNTVSFYVNWALLEGTPGKYTAEGVFALEPFFEAATGAGIYLIARPGPYTNGEMSGGGYPGWLQRVKGTLRTRAPDYLAATDNYAANVAATIANAQITNGGPVILYQVENEYSNFCCGITGPDGEYMQYVIDQARNAGIVVPIVNNDASPHGNNAPNTGQGSVEIYGHDGYPLGNGCAKTTIWPNNTFPTDYRALHLAQSPSTPYSLNEYQAGFFDPWGGAGYDKCAEQLNQEYERVYYKNDYSFGVTIFNLYMIYGGTNWGNLGYPSGYTSYDYGAAISEDRQLTREKYSELKLQAQFLKVSPSYLNAVPGNLSMGVYTNTPSLTVTPLVGNGSYFIVRHSNATGLDSQNYTLYLPTKAGKATVPQLGGSLSLNGRDSKIHVTDYDVAGTNIQYSTAEIMTWKEFNGTTVLIVYGGPGELHEISIDIDGHPSVIEGSDVKIQAHGGSVILNWETSAQRRIVRIGKLDVLLLDRNSAYNYWVPEISQNGISPGFSSAAHTANSIIIKAGYLVRNAYIKNNQLHLSADFNATTPLEIIGASKNVNQLYINAELVPHQIVDKTGYWTASVEYDAPIVTLPKLESLEWKYIDSLPEVQPGYDDSAWTAANHSSTNNTRPLSTPTSLYSSDYGYNTGYHLYRGHFVATGNETSLFLHTQGGAAFGHSIWLNQTHLGSWSGISIDSDYNVSYQLPNLATGKPYVITILLDHMGLEENWIVGQDLMKTPRGILNYILSNRNQTAITWKITGNLGGENYIDQTRGPLNEGGVFAERQGWHQPDPPSQNWEVKSITNGISAPGVGFFTTSFELNILEGWDVPLYFVYTNQTSPTGISNAAVCERVSIQQIYKQHRSRNKVPSSGGDSELSRHELDSVESLGFRI